MKKSVIFITIILIILIIGSLIVHATTKKEEPTLDEKIAQELIYMQRNLNVVLGHLNGFNLENKYLGADQKNAKKEYKADWDAIQIKMQEIYQTWNTITIDLHSAKIDSNLILNFSDYLNNSMQSIQRKEKDKSIESVATLCTFIPQYLKNNTSMQEKKLTFLNIQVAVSTAYAKVTNEKWDEASQNLSQAEQTFSRLLNTVDKEEQNQAMIGQAYILINELNKAVNLKDKDIFYIHYQNFISKMQTLL